MGITTDFNVFANNYHKQNNNSSWRGVHTYFSDSDDETTCPTGTTQPNIMSSLPNDLIMLIIKEADGGKSTHKSKYINVMGELNKIIHEGGDEWSINHYYNNVNRIRWTEMNWTEVWEEQLSHVLFDMNRNEQNGIPAPDGIWDETPHDEYIIASTRTF